MRAGSVMAKKAGGAGKQPVGPPGDEGDDQIRIRMSKAFKAWVQRYAEFRHLKMSDTIVQDLIEGAKAKGFTESPPKR